MNTKTKLITTGYHLPYNPKLKEKARHLRNNMTVAEKKLWYKYLKQFPLPVYRQKPINNYIVDFYCPKLKLVIEIDGETHIKYKDKKYDERRTKVLEGYGLKVLRFWNYDILGDLDGLDAVSEIINNELLNINHPNPSLLKRGISKAKQITPTPLC